MPISTIVILKAMLDTKKVMEIPIEIHIYKIAWDLALAGSPFPSRKSLINLPTDPRLISQL